MLTENSNKGNYDHNEVEEEEKSVDSKASSSSGEWSMVVEEEQKQQQKEEKENNKENDVKVVNNNGTDNEDDVAKAITETLSACASAIDSLMEEMKKDSDSGGGAATVVVDGEDATHTQPPVAGVVIPQAQRAFSIEENDDDKGEEDQNAMEASALTVPSVPTEMGSLMDMSTKEEDDGNNIIIPHQTTTTRKDKVADTEDASSLTQSNSLGATTNVNDHSHPPASSSTDADITTAENNTRHSYPPKPIIMLLLLITSIISIISTTEVVYLEKERSAWKTTALELQNELDDIKAKEEERQKMEPVSASMIETDDTDMDSFEKDDAHQNSHSKQKEEVLPENNIFFDTLSDKCSSNENDSSSSSFVLDNCWVKAKISISSGLCLDNFKERSKAAQKDFVSYLKRFHETAQESFWGEYYNQDDENENNSSTSEGSKDASAMIRSSVRGLSKSFKRMMMVGVGNDDSENVGDSNNDTMHTKTNTYSSSKDDVNKTVAAPFANEVSKLLRAVGEGYFYFMEDEKVEDTTKDSKNDDMDEDKANSNDRKTKLEKDISETITTIETVMEDKMEQVAESIKQGVSSIVDLIGGVTRDSMDALHATK